MSHFFGLGLRLFALRLGISFLLRLRLLFMVALLAFSVTFPELSEVIWSQTEGATWSRPVSLAHVCGPRAYEARVYEIHVCELLVISWVMETFWVQASLLCLYSLQPQIIVSCLWTLIMIATQAFSDAPHSSSRHLYLTF